MLTTCRRNARTSHFLLAQGIAKRTPVASIRVICTLLLLGLLGCQRELDMAKTYDDRNAETTLRYIGVREGTRQYADYSSIRGTILTEPEKAEGSR